MTLIIAIIGLLALKALLDAFDDETGPRPHVTNKSRHEQTNRQGTVAVSENVRTHGEAL